MADIYSILKDHWGFSSFRPLQETIIQTILDGKDCLALLPTGGGKSLCFQVPAMAKPGLCLVVSPLIALMKDQVQNLRKKNITAFSIHSGMTRKEVKNTLSLAGNSNCKFLYVSPERLETNLFKEYLLSLDVCMIAVDEAHCISQWGYDFRPAYLRIADLRGELPGIPVLALTASATEEVQNDICNKLLFKEKKVFRQSFERPNLSYSAFNVPSKINRIRDVLDKVQGSAIVYCRSRKRTREISELLNMHGISADYYHAGLLQEQRNEKQEAWIKNTVRTIVCTNAFGMGIDKPDVRVVIHADTPDCLENYYQEAGRAGRDGKRSYAVLLYNHKEIEELKELPSTRFPPIEVIRNIYQSLMNHLQVASGTGEGNYYEIDINTFIRQFALDTQAVLSALKTLEQEELLYFNEQVFVQAKIQVTGDKEQLQEFEKYKPELDGMVRVMLRIYEGIMDQPVNISEKTIAGVVKKPLEEVERSLHTLHAHGIINYIPRKEKPQVYFLQNRVKAEDLRINIENYRNRKKKFVARIEALINFVYASAICRSVIIGNYFGDASIRPCGICDVCLEAKKTALSKAAFENLYSGILELINPSPLSVNEIGIALKNTPKEKMMEVIRFLQSENRIVITEKGLVKKAD